MRLIDADELKAVITGYDYSEAGNEDRICFEFLYEEIDRQPTAYDLEAVEEQIEEYIKAKENCDCPSTNLIHCEDHGVCCSCRDE